MFTSTGKKLKISFLITITIGQSSMQFFPSLLFIHDQILRNNGLFPSLNNFKRQLNREINGLSGVVMMFNIYVDVSTKNLVLFKTRLHSLRM